MEGLKICIISVSQWHGYLIKTFYFFFFFPFSFFSPLSCWHYCNCIQCPHSVRPVCSEESNPEGDQGEQELKRSKRRVGTGGKEAGNRKIMAGTERTWEKGHAEGKRIGSGKAIDFRKEGKMKKGVCEKWKFTRKKQKDKTRGRKKGANTRWVVRALKLKKKVGLWRCKQV